VAEFAVKFWVLPALRTTPDPGGQTNVPTLAVAFNCVAPRAAGYVMSAGFDQVMSGVPF
jgi:hypothetical protein